MFNTSKEELQAMLQQLDQALYNHKNWLDELTRTIICRLPYDPNDVAEDAHRQCRFGKWCYGNPPQAFREHPAFVATAIEHHRMHQLGARLLLASAHDASGLPKDYDSFRNALDRLRLEIDTLKCEIEDSMYNRDPLTGAENRVRMLTKLRELHEAVKRRVHPCGIAIMDLDHLKTINDNYGHPMGDQVLSTAVRHVMAHLRPYDSVFRYGGDEFLISLSDADPQITKTVIERICEGFATLTFATDRPKAISTTVSFGITQLDPDVSVEESINRADMALYAAKTSGRNCACVWDPSMKHKLDGETGSSRIPIL
ncbi:MAG: diguanylate cyclase [Deltaproteobacteria bacterium]|nr:diguanylate cyclase [Deltaproteobacteria bacterium]